MPTQEDRINENREAMQRRADSRARGESPGRAVPLSRAQARARINVLQAEINRLRAVPPDMEQLRSELASVRAAHSAAIAERDMLESSLATTREERDRAQADLATVRKSIVPAP